MYTSLLCTKMNSKINPSFLNKYAMTASLYAFIRKPIVLKNHKIQKHDHKNGYSDLLITEIIPLSFSNAVIGIWLSPLFVCKDMQNLEINLRGSKNDFYNKYYYEHYSLIDLFFI